MKLIKKYLFGKPVILSDLTGLVALGTLNQNSEAAQAIKQSAVNDMRYVKGEPLLHYVAEENPTAFNYNDNLMVRGSELLKYPQLYTNMGWLNTKNSNILPDLYYKIGNNGLFDPTHFISFNNSDTYTPIPELYLLQVLNSAFAANNKYGLINEKRKQGLITEDSYMDLNPVLTGYIPAADAMAANGNPQGAIDVLSGQTAVLNAASGFTPAGYTFFTPLMLNSGYERIKNGLDWKDYVLGGGEMLLAAAPWLYKGYTGIRSAFSPNYRLANVMNKELLYSDFDYYNEPYNIKNYIKEVPEIGSTRELHATYGTKYDWSPSKYSVHFINLPSIEELNRALENGFKLAKKLPEELLPGESTSVMGAVSSEHPASVTHMMPRFLHINFDPTNEPRFNSGSLGFRLGFPTRVRLNLRGEDSQVIEIPGTPEYIEDLALSDELTNTLKFIVTKGEDGQLKVTSVYPDVLGFDVGKSSLSGLSREHTLKGIPGENPRFIKAQLYWDTHLLHLGKFNKTSPEAMLQRFPDYLFDPSKVDMPVVTEAKKMGEIARDKILKDIESPEYLEHLRRELGSRSYYKDIPSILRRRYNDVSIYGIDPRPNDYPGGGAGIATYLGKNGPGMHNDLELAGKIPKGKTESWYTSQLDPYESAAYARAKLRKPVVEIEEGEASARYNIAQEEMGHIPDLNEYLSIYEAPPMLLFDAHNDPIIEAIIAHRPQFGGKEFLTRAREALRAYRTVKSRLPNFYKGRTSMDTEYKFYQDLLNGSESLFKAFPELREFMPTQNRLIWELGHEYVKTPAYWHGVQHIVLNDSNSLIDNIT